MATSFLTPANNAETTLNTAIDDDDTTIVVVDGTTFPSSAFHITIGGEIIYVATKSSNTFSTCVRARESTSAAAHAAGVAVQLRPTAKALSDLNAAVNALETGKKLIATTHDVSVTGDQEITGVGFQPTACILFSAEDGSTEASWGLIDPSGDESCIVQKADGTFSQAAVVQYHYTDGANYASAIYKSWDADGLTITWSKTGSPTGTQAQKFLFLK